MKKIVSNNSYVELLISIGKMKGHVKNTLNGIIQKMMFNPLKEAYDSCSEFKQESSIKERQKRKAICRVFVQMYGRDKACKCTELLEFLVDLYMEAGDLKNSVLSVLNDMIGKDKAPNDTIPTYSTDGILAKNFDNLVYDRIVICKAVMESIEKNYMQMVENAINKMSNTYKKEMANECLKVIKNYMNVWIMQQLGIIRMEILMICMVQQLTRMRKFFKYYLIVLKILSFLIVGIW